MTYLGIQGQRNRLKTSVCSLGNSHIFTNSDAFYIQFFCAAFPEIDFSQLEEATNEDEMAANIQALIDLLGGQILKYDLSHIRGDEIVSGNPEHCINLLQLVQEISVMLLQKEEAGGDEEMEDEDEEEQLPTQKQVDKSRESRSNTGKNLQQQESSPDEDEEDDEAQIIHQRKQRQQQQQQPQKSASGQKQRGRSYSDDKGKPQFEMDDFDISNDFNVQMNDDDEDDDALPPQAPNQHLNMQNLQHQALNVNDNSDDDDFDEDDMKLYEQYLGSNHDPPSQSNQKKQGAPPGPLDNDDEDEGEEEEIDFDNIDYEQLDPQILEIAEQMGVHPKEVLKQIMQMQNQEEDEEYGEEGQPPNEEEDEDEEIKEIEKQMQEEQLRKEKEAFKAQMGLSSEKKKSQGQQQQQNYQQKSEEKKTQSHSAQKHQPQKQPPPQYLQNYDYDDEDEESYYSEGEIKTRIKLLSQKSYSAPYIIINDCFDEPLYDSESNIDQKAYSTTMLQSLEVQEQMQGEGEMDDETVQLLQQYQQQQQMHQLQQQQQYQQQHPQGFQQQKKPSHTSKITEVSKSKESSSYGGNGQQKRTHQQPDDDEMEIDISEKLKGLHSHQQDDDDEEDEDDEQLIDLDQLDDQNKQMLLEYLHQEYEKNPDQFPFPKELIEDYMLKQGQREEESVKDIKSEEMIVEEANQQQTSDQIEGGEQELEDDEDNQELTNEQQAQLQQYLMQQQQEQQQQDYGDEDDQGPMQPTFPQNKSKKGKKPRGKSAARQHTVPEYTDISQIPPDTLQQVIQLLQDQQIDIENVDPNLLQQLIIAQAQALQQYNQERQSRPATAKRKSSGSKKRPITAGNKGLSKLQPYQVPKSMKILQPATPGSHFKSFSTQRSKAPVSLKKKKKSAKKRPIQSKIPLQPVYQMPHQQFQQENDQFQPQLLDIPNLSEDFLNQLSEDQLEQLLQHQQQLMLMQQQQMDKQQVLNKPSITRKTRPKSAKKKKPTVPQTYSNYYQPGVKTKKGTKGKKKKGTKRQPQGVMLNNYFPALEAGMGQDGDLRDQRYPKFGTEHINNQLLQQQEAIDEVPPEQEEGESQEIIQQQPNFYQQQDQDQDEQEEDQDAVEQEGEEDQDHADPIDYQQQQQEMLSDEQLIELIQNAPNMTLDQQAQLQMILQQRMKMDPAQERANSYQNIYHILMNNVQKAKDRLAPLGQVSQRIGDLEETDARIIKQKAEFETLYRIYQQELKNRENKKQMEDAKLEKKLQRESKINAIKERKFQEDLVQQQKSMNYKRNAQQVKLCKKVYKLASDLEKNKLLAEKKEYKEMQMRKKLQSKLAVDTIETQYKNQIQMLKERIENERFERKIAQQAQQQALARMKRELNDQKKREVDKYLQMLRQEDQRYDFESSNGNKLEKEIIRMYKK